MEGLKVARQRLAEAKAAAARGLESRESLLDVLAALDGVELALAEIRISWFDGEEKGGFRGGR